MAAELARLGLIASPTSRSARGADILATTADCNKAFSVEVKTTTNSNFWQLGKHAKEIDAKSHVYVFVRIKKKKSPTEIDEITYYPSQANLSATMHVCLIQKGLQKNSIVRVIRLMRA